MTELQVCMAFVLCSLAFVGGRISLIHNKAEAINMCALLDREQRDKVHRKPQNDLALMCPVCTIGQPNIHHYVQEGPKGIAQSQSSVCQDGIGAR